MKNTTFLILLFSILTFISCENKTTPTEENQIIALKGYEKLDLTSWGFPMTIMVPDVENNGEALVEATNRGALEIRVGKNFGMEIIYGEGDIYSFKSSLEEDPIFITKIIREDSTLLVYKQDIPDSGVKTQYHFFFKTIINNEIYEVHDLQSEQFNEKAIEDMLKAAQTLSISVKNNKQNV